MRILIINGSPKGEKSNSLRLTNAFIKGVCDANKNATIPTEVEYLHISKLDIQGCKGCFACWKSTLGKCCIKDDMAMVQMVVLLNNIMPMFMGIFTVWFQKWYPAWVVGGKTRTLNKR